MRVRHLVAAGLLSFVPAFVRAQDVPPAEPAQDAPAPTAAYREGSIEFTAGAGIFVVDKALNAHLSLNTVQIANPGPSALMGGGEMRVTWNLSRHLGIGAGAAMHNGNGALLIAPFGALTYTLDLDRTVSPFVELGAELTRVARYSGGLLGDAVHRETSTYGAFGGLGVRMMLGRALALRVEGRMSYDHFVEVGTVFDAAGYVGLSLFVGGRPRPSAGGAVAPPEPAAIAPAPAPAPTRAPAPARAAPAAPPADTAARPAERAPAPDRAPLPAAAAPLDRDQDGVPDQFDRCPNTPPDARPVYPASHERAGCPADSDGDGVPDYRDRCAGTASDARVDANGCPPAALPAATGSLVLRNVNFRPNSAVLLPSSMAELDNLAAALRAAPGARWEIAGYTDNRGLAARNRQLSQLRASMVLRSLVVRGVPAASLTAVGMGSRHPVASNRTEAGRALNRRVEIRRLP
jgi:OmpA-OmpF porin, OOP family